MTNVWIHHPETGGVVEVPESAVPIYRQSGWDLVSKKDVTARAKAEAEASIEAEKAMQDATARANAKAEAEIRAAAEAATTKKENG